MTRNDAKELLGCPAVCNESIRIEPSQLLFMSLVFGGNLENMLPGNISQGFMNSILFKTDNRIEIKKRRAILEAYAEGKPIEILSGGNRVAVIRDGDSDVNFAWDSYTFKVLEESEDNLL